MKLTTFVDGRARLYSHLVERRSGDRLRLLLNAWKQMIKIILLGKKELLHKTTKAHQISQGTR